MHWFIWVLKWSKFLGVGLLHDAGWALGLWTPFGDDFSPDRWCIAQRWESMVRLHCDIAGIRWRDVDGGAMYGIRAVFLLWCWARAEEKRQIKLAQRLSGLKIKTLRGARAFFDFITDQTRETSNARKTRNENDSLRPL